MINENTVKDYCKDYSNIDNYEEAVNDNTKTWVCHHILGEILTREQLILHNFYYDVPPCMLKFVTREEHNKIHKKSKKLSCEHRRKLSEALKGHAVTDDTRIKLSESHKGHHHSDETRQKISESQKGKTLSEESRRKISESKKGKSSWNKGRHLSEETRKKISKNGKGKHSGWCPSVEWREKAKDRVHKKSAFYQKFGMTVDEYKIHNKLTCSCSTIRRMFKNGDI